MVLGNKVNELLGSKKGPKQRVNIYVDRENYAAFQQACEIKGLTASETIDALMADFVEQHGPAKVREISQVPKKLG